MDDFFDDISEAHRHMDCGPAAEVEQRRKGAEASDQIGQVEKYLCSALYCSVLYCCVVYCSTYTGTVSCIILPFAWRAHRHGRKNPKF